MNRELGELMVTLVTHRDGTSERNGIKSIPVRALAASRLSKVLLNAVGEQVRRWVTLSWKSLDVTGGKTDEF